MRSLPSSQPGSSVQLGVPPQLTPVAESYWRSDAWQLADPSVASPLAASNCDLSLSSACAALAPSPGPSECSAPSTGQHDMNRLKPDLVYLQPQADSGVQTSRTGIERREEARASDPPPRAIYAQSSVPQITQCAYLRYTGNPADLDTYVATSTVLKWEDEGTKNRLRFKDKHTMLVFGGDSQFNGICDIRLTKLLLDLKAQKGNEDRVELIIGSRDANKLRLASELHQDCISDLEVQIGMRE
jgi:hypothetical protein